MKRFDIAAPGGSLSILCLGAHSDDIEIGAGGTILGLLGSQSRLAANWYVFSAEGARRGEAERSAADFLEGAESSYVELFDFDDTFFPAQIRPIKDALLRIRERCAPDVVFTHRRDDAHQDHRTLSELTYNVFRDHLILEYEIPKWDGDLGRPNAFVPLGEREAERKVSLLDKHFGSQRSKDWFDRETFLGLARLRGLECRSPSRLAEGFTMRKLVLDTGLSEVAS